MCYGRDAGTKGLLSGVKKELYSGKTNNFPCGKGDDSNWLTLILDYDSLLFLITMSCLPLSVELLPTGITPPLEAYYFHQE